MKRKGKIKMVVLIILGVLIAGMGAGIIFTGPGRQEAMNLTFSDAGFANLRDGTYVGEYKGQKDSMRNNKVQITVALGKVSEIKVLEGALAKHDKPVELRNGMTIDTLFGKVIQSQSLGVDVISGATITSKVHLKAVENALASAQSN